MQPSAAEVERRPRGASNGPRAASEARTSLNNQTIDTRLVQTAGCRNTGCAAADNYRLEIAIGHS
jgi:hypothetical protein